MKKVLYLVALASVFVACNKIERKPFGDGILTLVENQTKGVKGLENNGKVVLPVEYADIRLSSCGPSSSEFIVKDGKKEVLYGYFSAAFGDRLAPIFEADTIYKAPTIDEHVFMIIGNRGSQKYICINLGLSSKILGPYDEVYVGSATFVFKKDGLLGISNSRGKEIYPAQYRDIYIIHYKDAFVCLEDGKGSFLVKNLYKEEIGKITLEEINTMKKYASSVGSEKVFVVGKYDIPTSLQKRYSRIFKVMYY